MKSDQVVLVFAFTPLVVWLTIDDNRIDIVVLGSIVFIYSSYYVVTQIILKKPLFVIDQEGIKVRVKRLTCSYESILSMELQGEKHRQVLIITYVKNNKNHKKVLMNSYDIKLDEIKKIILENIEAKKSLNEELFEISQPKTAEKHVYLKEELFLIWGMPIDIIIFWQIALFGSSFAFPENSNYIYLGLTVLAFIIATVTYFKRWSINRAIYLHAIVFVVTAIYTLYYMIGL